MKRFVVIALFVVLLPVSSNALTLAGLRFMTSDKLGQDTSSATKYWSNAAQNAWINAAIRHISLVALCYTRDTAFAIEVSKTNYNMPSDYIKAEGILIAAKGASADLDWSPIGLKPTNPSDLGKNATPSPLPTEWRDLGERTRKIRFAPSPAVACTAVVTFFAYDRTLDSDTMTCNLPLAFQDLVPVCAAADLWSRTRQGNPYWQEFIERLSLLVPAIQRRTEEETPSAKPGNKPTP